MSDAWRVEHIKDISTTYYVNIQVSVRFTLISSLEEIYILNNNNINYRSKPISSSYGLIDNIDIKQIYANIDI